MSGRMSGRMSVGRDILAPHLDHLAGGRVGRTGDGPKVVPAGDGEESVGERINDDGFEDGWERHRK